MSVDDKSHGSLGALREDDAELRARFAELRAYDAEHAAPFARVLTGRRVGTRWGWLAPAAALGAAALLVLFWRERTAGRELQRAPVIAFVPGELRVPTDYFLDLAPSLRVDELPDIGAVDWYPLDSLAMLSPRDTSRSR